MKVLVPVQYSGPLPTFPGESGVQVITHDSSGTVPEEHRDAEVLVVWGQGPNYLSDAAKNMPNLQLVQALAAGPDALMNAGFAQDVRFSSGVGLHDGPVAEHALALLLALLRDLPEALASQAKHEWNGEIGGLQTLRTEAGRTRTLLGARVTIWGFGSIGQTLAPMLAAMGAEVTGVARSEGERAGFRTVTEDSFDSVLPKTDVLVMVLPNSPATVKALNDEVLGKLPESAYVVNVGRGSTVDEDALLRALNEGRLAGAGLDVTETEPLPAESPLWDAPRLLLTPHAAGGRPIGADALIEENVAALREGRELRNEIDRA